MRKLTNQADGVNHARRDCWLSLGEAIPDVLVVVDRAGRILYTNRATSDAARDVQGNSVFDFAVSVPRKELEESLARIFATGEPRSRELQARLPDGTLRWYAIHTRPARTGRRIVGAAIFARDMTDRRRTEAALHESEERYRTVVEHAPEAIVVFDADDCRFVEGNRNACELFGMSRAELFEADPFMLSPPSQPSGEQSTVAARRYISDALAGGVPVFDWIHRTAANEDIRCEVRLVRLPAEGRQLVRGSVTDVTRQRELEEAVRVSCRMEALGALARGVAHDFNNILTIIRASLDCLGTGLERAGVPSSVAGAEIEEIRSASRRGADLARQLLAFAQQRRPRHERIDLNKVVSELTAMVRRVVPARIRVVTALDPGGAFVRGQRSHVDQILMNLLLNARAAMPCGGKLTVTTTNTPGRVVHLRVHDTGVGMDATTAKRVFDPLFTTKPVGRGTGLGLATVRTIVAQMGGHVQVASEPERGTTFDVMLPGAA